MKHLDLNEYTSQYNHANRPKIMICSNGTTDIVKDINDDEKISVVRGGIFSFIKLWLTISGHHLFKEEVDELIEILLKYKK